MEFGPGNVPYHQLLHGLGKTESDNGSSLGPTLDADSPAMSFRNQPAKIQTQTCAALNIPVRGFYAIILVKELREMIGRYPQYLSGRLQ